LKLDLSPYRTDSFRNFSCDLFRIQATIATPLDIKRVARRWLGPCAIPVVRERAFTFDAEAAMTASPAYLDGYWQSENYFSAVAEIIRHDFTLAAPMSARRADIFRQIAGCNAVAVHVRRGDYADNPRIALSHGTCPPEWHRETMGRMAAAVGDPTFFVFSDSPGWARANLPDDWPAIFVDPGLDGRDAEDIHLMAACRHQIIANSTFSWWGAWLNPRPDKRVIAPKRWFNQATHDTRDLIPSGWERV
jgi:hypothetical protein